MKSLLFFEPIYQERVWGGRKLSTHLGRVLPEGDQAIGESWEIVDREHEQSVVRDGEYKGMTIKELREQHCAEIFGKGVNSQKPFPLLVKWLDCRERLSLQVHPPHHIAESLGGEPKTENWYVAETEGDAAVLAGLKEGISKETFEEALRKEALEPLVRRMPTQAGDSLLVKSGQIHAIDGGNLILEIQQNSDTTYRVYDWGRVGLDGKPRELHIEESLLSIDFSDQMPRLVKPEGNPQLLAEAREFRIVRWTLPSKEQELVIDPQPQARLGHLVKGSVRSKEAPMYEIPEGSNFLIPANLKVVLHAQEASTFLLTDQFYPMA